MFLKLRIIFTILSCICAAAVIPVGAFLGFIWAGLCIVAAFAFYVFMLIFKQKQEERETSQLQQKANETQPQGETPHLEEKNS